MDKGFTLVEIIISIFVMAVGIVGIYSLLPKIISISSGNLDKLAASQLAKEGVEIVRNIRDANLLAGNAFDQDLADGDYQVQYDKKSLLPWANAYLKISSNGFYNYSVGSQSKFKRKIIIFHPDSDSLDIESIVSWAGKGSPLDIEEILYNWR